MAYTTINKPSNYFDTKLYTGNGSTQTISGLGFSPDFVWIKNRIDAASHSLYDIIRGADACIQSSNTGAEFSQSNNGLTSFNSNGFSVGNVNDHNGSGDAMVSWNWDANGAGVSNTQGSITSTVSANTTSGFSIVSYTGNGTGGATVGHGLGAVPKMIIVKYINSGSYNWCVQHASIGNTVALFLNDTASTSASSTYWNNTSPTSSVFTLGSSAALNNNTGTFIAYCFAEVKGFSKFGSYTGNGSTDGTFVYTGFTPAFLMVKQTNASGENWYIFDNKRVGYNAVWNRLYPSSSAAEDSATNLGYDFLSNGFKARASYTGMNASGGTYIYMAFAENPLVGTNNVPATAR